ncbi:MAG: thiol peroxidase [Coxiellaceae bacterium]|nr:thiol peroxidase [Coxiellaceae bacterium]
MAEITFQGFPLHTTGDLPNVGAKAPDFNLVGVDLQPVNLTNFVGKKVILNIFPSVDTPTCSASVRRFNELAAGKADTVVLCISKDLPFAHGRFCGSNGIKDVVSLSAFNDDSFVANYPIDIIDGPTRGLLARAVVVLDSDHNIVHTQLVGELADEPDYDKALAALE